METPVYDYIVIGSGFGGSVSAMRLAEKGYSVLVLEKGKRFGPDDYPRTNWQLRKYLWAPLIRCFGIQQLTFFREVFILSGTGVGGGSLVYANTLLTPPDSFFEHPSWAHFRDWKSALMPFYERARFMLGSTTARYDYPDDQILSELAHEMGRGHTFHGGQVGVYYGDPDKRVDPYFKGLGPLRNGCRECAGCMVGCRYNAKNTLDKNYLYFAEKYGAEVIPETTATKVEYDAASGLYTVNTYNTTAWLGGGAKQFRSRGIVFSAGVLGTLKLLFAQKYQYRTLGKLSGALGELLRTNSESLCGVVNANTKLNNGVAISSGFYPDDNTHVELCKFPDRSDAMLKLATLAAGPGHPLWRTLKLFGNILRNPLRLLRALFSTNVARNSVILLVMQNLDNAMKMVWQKGLLGPGLRIKNPNSNKNRVPAYIEPGQQTMYRLAEKVGGTPMNAITEILFDMSSTAHIIGGCPMGRNDQEGVVDDRFAVFNYPNMYVLDGSIIPGNLGVNPSLTITALSEYAMAQIPEKDGNERVGLEAELAMRG